MSFFINFDKINKKAINSRMDVTNNINTNALIRFLCSFIRILFLEPTLLNFSFIFHFVSIVRKQFKSNQLFCMCDLWPLGLSCSVSEPSHMCVIAWMAAFSSLMNRMEKLYAAKIVQVSNSMYELSGHFTGRTANVRFTCIIHQDIMRHNTHTKLHSNKLKDVREALTRSLTFHIRHGSRCYYV